MQFALGVFGAPYTHQASDTAYKFALAALDNGHSIYRIFFYHDGVLNANGLSVPPQDEVNMVNRWAKLGGDYKVELAVCIAASLKRGILDKGEADRYEKAHFNIHPGFTIVGLGQWIDAMLQSDRTIVFGT